MKMSITLVSGVFALAAAAPAFSQSCDLVINGGRTLMPGLGDPHVHLAFSTNAMVTGDYK